MNIGLIFAGGSGVRMNTKGMQTVFTNEWKSYYHSYIGVF